MGDIVDIVGFWNMFDSDCKVDLVSLINVELDFTSKLNPLLGFSIVTSPLSLA